MTRVMFDSISVMSLPPGADLYGGYDDGAWPDAAAIALRFPGKTVVRFTVNPADNEGDCLDVETGDATPTQAPNWTWRRRQAGHRGPLTYCSEALWPTVRAAYRAQSIPEPGYIIAAYPGSVGAGQMFPPPSVGHQWIDRGAYDQSVMADYLPGIDPPPTPQPQEDDEMFIAGDPTEGKTYLVLGVGKVYIPMPSDVQALVAIGIRDAGNLSHGLMGNIPDTP